MGCPNPPTPRQQEIFDALTAGAPRYRHASRIDPASLALTGLLLGDGHTKEVFEIELRKLPELCLLASNGGDDWHDVAMLRRLESHWLGGQAGWEGRA